MSLDKAWKFHPAMIGHITTALMSFGVSLSLVLEIVNGRYGSNSGFDRLFEALLMVAVAFSFFALFIVSLNGVKRKHITKTHHFWIPLFLNIYLVIQGGFFIFFGNPPVASNVTLLIGLVGATSLLFFWKDYAKDEVL